MKRHGVGAVALLGFLLAALVGGAALYEALNVGRIYGGVHAGSVDLGNLTQAQAVQKLTDDLHAVAAQQVVVHSGLPGDDRTWSVAFGDLGLAYDVTATVDAAYAQGRQGNSFARLGEQFLVPATKPAVTPVYHMDQARLAAFVDQLAAAIDQPVRDAGVKLQGAALQVTAAQEGRQLDRQDALAQLQARVAQLSTAPVTLKVAVTPPVTGNADVSAAVAQARRWVSTDLVLETPAGSVTLRRDQIAGLIRLSQQGGKGPLVATLDESALRALLAPLAKQLDQPAQSAQFAVRDGALVVAQAGSDGRSLDLDAATTAVTAAIKSGQGVLRLPVAVTHPDLYSLEDAAAVQGQVAQLAGQPVTLQAAGQSWTLSPRDLSALLTLGTTQQDGKQQLTLSVQTDQAAALIAKIAEAVDQPAQNARFAWQDNALKVLTPSKEGRTLDQVAATTALLNAMQGGQRTVALPVTVAKPAVASDHPEQLGIKDLVAEGTSNFAGSPPERIQNIRRGAELVNGTVIAPGAVFSFDDTVGDISTANGFTTGLVIIDHETQNGIGGGICQVSTTVFRAAFWAGLPIVERHDHAYAVPYYTQGGYPEGFDATIYSPQLDLKFTNDTPGYLLLQTSMDVATNTLKVSLYGTKTGRVVKLIAGPETNRVAHPPDLRKPDPSLPKGVVEQVDWAHDGFDTWVKRTITVNGQTTTDTFKSHAQPWQAIYLVGTGAAAPAKKA